LRGSPARSPGDPEFSVGKVQIDPENLGERDIHQLLALKGDPSQVIFIDHD
jgi:hypothetical protein